MTFIDGFLKLTSKKKKNTWKNLWCWTFIWVFPKIVVYTPPQIIHFNKGFSIKRKHPFWGPSLPKKLTACTWKHAETQKETRPSSHHPFSGATVDGSEIRLTTKDDDYPIIYYRFQKHPNGGCLGFQNHQRYVVDQSVGTQLIGSSTFRRF